MYKVLKCTCRSIVLKIRYFVLLCPRCRRRGLLLFCFVCLFFYEGGGGGCKPKQCNEFKSLICIYSQLERLDQLFEEEPFLLLAGIKCTSPWPVTMVTTTLNMVSLQTIYVRKNLICLPLENIVVKIS